MGLRGAGLTVTSEFAADVQKIVGPVLKGLGFILDGIDDNPDEGGRRQDVVYYRSDDCKLQIYDSSREGEINCMIAPLSAPNQFGLTTKKWHYISRFSKRSDLPPQERLRVAIAEAKAYENQLDWVRDRIAKHYESAHAGILEKYENER
jgi:hypothetical protein